MFLVLLLMLSLLMVASAATKPTAETNEHHTMRKDYVSCVCTVCNTPKLEWTDYYYESHTLPCDICKGT